jgi:pimeloyl-ACP methyl ester carboxylesterase
LRETCPESPETLSPLTKVLYTHNFNSRLTKQNCRGGLTSDRGFTTPTGYHTELIRRGICVYTWIATRPVSDAEMARVIQEFSYTGITRAVSRYFNSSSFRQEWLERRRRMLASWTCPVVIMQGYDSKSQPREFYERAREYVPNARGVEVSLCLGGISGLWRVRGRRLRRFGCC